MGSLTPQIPPARRRGAIHERDWTQLSDEQLLKLRLCDLRLDLRRTPLQRCVERLYDELEGRGIRFRPHCGSPRNGSRPMACPASRSRSISRTRG